MKHLLELNIGLSTPDGGMVNSNLIHNALTGAGFIHQTSRIDTGDCKQGEEPMLVWLGTAPADWLAQLDRLSLAFDQECIAYKLVGFAGPKPYDEFKPDLFKPALVPDDSAATRDNCARSFIQYLEETLIPDLRESGSDATAQDFETLIDYYSNK